MHLWDRMTVDGLMINIRELQTQQILWAECWDKFVKESKYKKNFFSGVKSTTKFNTINT